MKFIGKILLLILIQLMLSLPIYLGMWSLVQGGPLDSSFPLLILILASYTLITYISLLVLRKIFLTREIAKLAQTFALIHVAIAVLFATTGTGVFVIATQCGYALVSYFSIPWFLKRRHLQVSTGLN